MIISKPNTKEYDENYDRIFHKDCFIVESKIKLNPAIVDDEGNIIALADEN